MGWIAKVLRRAWSMVIHSRKRGRGIGMLYEDVQLCAYEDVQVMWTMLQHTNTVQQQQKEQQQQQMKQQRKGLPFWFRCRQGPRI